MMQPRWMRRFGMPLLTAAVLALSLPAAAQQSTTPSSPVPQVYNPAACANDTLGEPLSAACAAMIAAFPEPANVAAVEQDRTTLSLYSFWRVGPQPTPLYAAPEGAITGEIPAGFNFVTATNLSVDGWLQIQGGQWVRQSDARYAEPSYFTGVEITDGLDYPFAWVLDLSMIYTSEYPGGPASTATGRFLRRYERVNIFSVAYDSEGWRWYMIGPNQWVKQTFVAKAQKLETLPEGVSGRWVAIDLYEQTLIAYEDDTPVYATLISSGLPNTSTNEGMFTIWARLPADGMSGATGAPNAYALQSVPWVMYFDGSISLHGTYWHDLFGYRQSRGCVNMTVSDARWLYEWLLAGQPDGSEVANQVYVHSTGEYGSGVLRQSG